MLLNLLPASPSVESDDGEPVRTRLALWHLALRLSAVPLACLALSAGAGAADEVYHYRISWNGLPAADATVTLAEPTDGDGALTRLHVEARTNRFIDLFWRLRAE